MVTLPSFVTPAQVRENGPLVQCITNTVVQGFTANALLAIGASPAMVDNPEDAGDFAAIASGVLINFGTPNAQHYGAANVAIPVANEAGKPWVLDPVGIGPMPHRTARIAEAAGRKPSIVRGNASEVSALAGQGAGGRGVDSTDSVESAIEAGIALARFTGGAVAISGAVDAVVAVEGETAHVARVEGGDPLLTQVIGTGCALGAISVAYAASGTPGPLGALEAAVGAHAHVAAAGTLARRGADEPGSYAVAYLDALAQVASGEVDQAGLVSVTWDTAALPALTVSL